MGEILHEIQVNMHTSRLLFVLERILQGKFQLNKLNDLYSSYDGEM